MLFVIRRVSFKCFQYFVVVGPFYSSLIIFRHFICFVFVVIVYALLVILFFFFFQINHIPGIPTS